MGGKYPIIAGGEGFVEVCSDNISHSELPLEVTIDGVNSGIAIPVYVLFSTTPTLITPGAARSDFAGIAGDEDYDCSGLSGYGAWLYDEYHPEGGWFDNVKFVEIDISGRVLKHSTDEAFNVAILANDRDIIDPPLWLRVINAIKYEKK